jgi:transposase-like protein
MTLESHDAAFDDRVIELIAERVAAMLREELEAIAAALARSAGSARPLTVDDVAERFGVARSTVYAHWREWGGYKLGAGQKAAIRFPPGALDASPSPTPGNSNAGNTSRRRTRRRGRAILHGMPRLPVELGDAVPEPEIRAADQTYGLDR